MLSPWQSCLRFSFKFSCVSGSLNQRANSSSTLLFRRGFNAIAVCFHTLLKKENNQTKCRDKLWRGIQTSNCLLHGLHVLLCSSHPPPPIFQKSFYIVYSHKTKSKRTSNPSIASKKISISCLHILWRPIGGSKSLL